MGLLQRAKHASSSRARPYLLRLVVWGTFLACLWLFVSFWLAYKLTHRARPPFPDPAPTLAWGVAEELRLHTEDGLGIGAWYIPGPDDGPSVLLVHGNGGSRGDSLTSAEVFAREGCSTLLISARAHGDSDGALNNLGYSARQDVLAACAYLERRRPGKSLLLQGVSLGSAAVLFASKDLGQRFRYVLPI